MPSVNPVLVALLAILGLTIGIPLIIALGGMLSGILLAVSNCVAALKDVRAQEK